MGQSALNEYLNGIYNQFLVGNHLTKPYVQNLLNVYSSDSESLTIEEFRGLALDLFKALDEKYNS